MKKQLTTGQRLAYMLRTAVVECQAVETGRHPNVELDMTDYRYRGDGKVCGCLGGIYAMLGRGLAPLCALAAWEDPLSLTPEELALDCLRQGDVKRAVSHVGGGMIGARTRDAVQSLICGHLENSEGRAPWNVYLEAADILERA